MSRSGYKTSSRHLPWKESGISSVKEAWGADEVYRYSMHNDVLASRSGRIDGSSVGTLRLLESIWPRRGPANQAIDISEAQTTHGSLEDICV